MRITEYEKKTIIKSIRNADPVAKIWVFDSRPDNHEKTGDIDIIIFSEHLHRYYMEEMQFRRSISDRIGDQNINIVNPKEKEKIFSKYNVAKGVLLYG